MRIVIVADVIDTGLGGMKTYAENLVRCIPEVDSENDYFVINHKRMDKDRNVQFIAVPYTKYPGKFFIRKFYQVPRKIRLLNPDVVMETTHMGPFFLANHVKRVTAIHDLSTFIQPQHYTWINRITERLLLPGVIKRADHIITVSQSTKRDIQDIFRVADNRLTVIPLGVEEIFRPVVNQKVLDRYHINKPYLLHVGTIQPRKNIETLVKAYEQFRSQTRDDFKLILVGKVGWKASGVLEIVNDSVYAKDIILTGHVPKEELPVFYTMCAVFVFPSHYEGFGLPLAEALACGARCIAADNSSLKEVGRNYVSYLKVNNAIELSRLIRECHSVINNGNTLDRGVFEEYSWMHTTQKTLQVFHRL